MPPSLVRALVATLPAAKSGLSSVSTTAATARTPPSTSATPAEAGLSEPLGCSVAHARASLAVREGRAGSTNYAGLTSVCPMCPAKAASLATTTGRQTSRPAKGTCPT